MGLREQARLDARAILEDASGFAWPVTLTSPLGVVVSVTGFTTDVGQSIDPETGQAVAGQRASFSVSRAALPELPEAVAERSRKPWLATFADSEGVIGTWKVIEVLPDLMLGVVVLILEVFKPAIYRFSPSTLTLPSLLLSGEILPVAIFTFSPATFTLPGLLLSGEILPVAIIEGPPGNVPPGADPLALPGLEIVGSIQPLIFVLGRSSQAFPVAATSHPVAVAALAGVGRKLLMLFCTGLNSAIAPPVGWFQLGATVSAVFSMAVFWKNSDGTETTATVGLDAPRGALARIYAIAGAHGAAPEQAVPGVNASVSGTNNVPGTVAPSWGSARNLYIAALGVDRSATPPNIDASPIGYTNTGEIQNVGTPPADCALGFGEKIATSGSDTPSAWTYGPGRSISLAVAVRPAA